MMSKIKPKTALAQLLDEAKGHANDEDAGVGGINYIYEGKDTSVASIETKHAEMTKQAHKAKILSIDPKLCRPWQFADRPEEEMGDLDSLLRSIKENGQLETILVRPVNNSFEFQYEVIFGNRRWRACKKGNMLVEAIVKEMSDQEAAVYQKEENERREGISELARARSYKKQIEAGLFKNESELSKKMDIAPTTLNDIMAFNRIPVDLANAIPNLYTISRATAVKLAVLARKKEYIPFLKKLGPKIGQGSVMASNLLDTVEAMARGETRGTTHIVKTIVNKRGEKIFSLSKRKTGGIGINITKTASNSIELDNLENVLSNFILGIDND